MILRSITRFITEEDVTQTHHAILPEGYELLFGIPASLLVFGLVKARSGSRPHSVDAQSEYSSQPSGSAAKSKMS